MRKIFAVALVCVGTPLELYFYWYRFVNEGMAGPIAIVAGIGLVMLLSILVYFLERNRKSVGLMAAVFLLSAFDVISTSAGQSFATLSITLANQGVEAKTSDAEWRIRDAETVISRLDKEYEASSRGLSSGPVFLRPISTRGTRAVSPGRRAMRRNSQVS